MNRGEVLRLHWELGCFLECEDCGDVPADMYLQPDGTEVTLCEECVKRYAEVSTPE